MGIADKERETEQLRLLRILLAVAAAISISVLVWTLNRPLIDQHGFRQTQTAISVYWMLHGGPWIDYQTPAVGAPWSIPFEFPLYQWLVALLVKATGMALDPAGRLVSYGWLIAGLWPAAWLARSYRLPPATGPIYALLLLASPVYLFWGRAFLIETQAVALSVAVLAFFRAWLLSRRILPWLLACLACAGATLTKVTTVPPFLLLAFFMMVASLRAESGQWRRQLATLAGSGAAILPGLLLFLLWNAHADALKMQNPVGDLLTSKSLTAWNFGTLAQRFSPFLPIRLREALFDVGGWLGLPLLLGAGWSIWRLRSQDRAVAGIVLALLVGWLSAFAIFTNLHLRHNYYQAGNAALLIGALAVALAVLGRHVRPLFMAALLAAVMTAQYARFAEAFAPKVAQGEEQADYDIGRALHDLTPPDTAILGVGLEWSPVTPFYAGRKALLIPSFAAARARSLLDDLPARLGGLRLGAVVTCPSDMDKDAALMARLAELHRGFAPRPSGRCMIYLAPALGAPRSA